MADWDEAAPLDNSVVSQFPANERAARSAGKTNFGIDHHETDDASVGKHEKVSLIEQSSDPTAVANSGIFYSKDTGGVTEAFYRDSAGNITPVTALGRVVGQLKPVVITTGTTVAVAGDMLLADKSGGNITVTLPASPSVGDEPISVTHVAGASNTLTIGRNSKLIMGLAEDLVIDTANASIVLYWSGDTNGWRLGIIG